MSLPIPNNSVKLIPPSWYPADLPLFYDPGNGYYLRPLPLARPYTKEDVLDVLLYLQTRLGWNRTDTQALDQVFPAAWKQMYLPLVRTHPHSGYIDVASGLKPDSYGDGSGNFAGVPKDFQIDQPTYDAMQLRAVERYSTQFPFIKDIQATGKGIDLLNLPRAEDKEVTRPSWYPNHLPSLFILAENGYLSTRFKIKGYEPTAEDVAAFLMYLMPVVANGPTPYNVNWFINNEFCGAEFARWCISNWQPDSHYSGDFLASGMFLSYLGFSNQEDLFKFPSFAVPHKTTLLDTISNTVVSIVKKIPVISTVYTAATAVAGALNEGVPDGTFAKEVGHDSSLIAEALKEQQAVTAQNAAVSTTKNYIAIGILAVLIVVALIYFISRKK